MLLGAIVSAVETNRRVRQMKVEGFKKADLARALGLKHPILQLHTGPDAKATRRTVLRIQKLWRERMAGEGPDTPLNVYL